MARHFFGWDSLVDETDLRCFSWKELQMHVNSIAVVHASKLVRCQKMSKRSTDFQTRFNEASPHVWISGFGITMSFVCVHWPVFQQQVTGAMTNLASNWFVGEPCPTPLCRPSHSLLRLSLIHPNPSIVVPAGGCGVPVDFVPRMLAPTSCGRWFFLVGQICRKFAFSLAETGRKIRDHQVPGVYRCHRNHCQGAGEFRYMCLATCLHIQFCHAFHCFPIFPFLQRIEHTRAARLAVDTSASEASSIVAIVPKSWKLAWIQVEQCPYQFPHSRL